MILVQGGDKNPWEWFWQSYKGLVCDGRFCHKDGQRHNFTSQGCKGREWQEGKRLNKKNKSMIAAQSLW